MVNRLAKSRATHVLTIPPPEPAGRAGPRVRVLAGASINVEEVENIIYHGAQATLARVAWSSRTRRHGPIRGQRGHDQGGSPRLEDG